MIDKFSGRKDSKVFADDQHTLINIRLKIISTDIHSYFKQDVFNSM
jgi:hypothetical protein